MTLLRASSTLGLYGSFAKVWVPFGGPYDKDYLFWGGPYWGPPILGNPPYMGIHKDVCMKGLTHGLKMVSSGS